MTMDSTEAALTLAGMSYVKDMEQDTVESEQITGFEWGIKRSRETGNDVHVMSQQQDSTRQKEKGALFS